MKPQRFWASLFENGDINYRNIWRSRAAANITAAVDEQKMVRVEVRVVKPKRKRKGARK